MVIGKSIDARSRCREQVARFDDRHAAVRECPIAVGLADRPGPEDEHFRSVSFRERAEHFEVAAVRSSIVAFRSATHRCKGRFVHEFGSGNGSADGARVFDEAARLGRRPDAVRVASSNARCERSDDARIHCMPEVDDAFPLLASQYAHEARWRLFWRRIRIGKPCRVGPRTAHAHIRRAKRCCELAQARVREIDRRAILIYVRIHTGWRIAWDACSSGFPKSRSELRPIRPPELPAGHFEHLDVIGLEALVYRPDAGHARRRQYNPRRVARFSFARHGTRNCKRQETRMKSDTGLSVHARPRPMVCASACVPWDPFRRLQSGVTYASPGRSCRSHRR